MKKLWIVTRAINQHDQDGEYFVTAYSTKPTFKQLKKLLSASDATTGKLLRGGGREDVENEWYYLKEHQEGKFYLESL